MNCRFVSRQTTTRRATRQRPAISATSTAIASAAPRARATLEQLLSGAQTYLSSELIAAAEQAVRLGQSGVSDSSARTYKYVTRHFQKFADDQGLDAFDPQTVTLYIGKCFDEGVKKATLRARLNGIRRMAVDAGYPDPLLDPVVQNVRLGAFDRLSSEPRRVTPATVDKLGALLDAAATLAVRRSANLSERQRDLLAKRDRALLLFGFATGRRGAEIAAVRYEDVQRKAHGLLVRIPRSKTNKGDEAEYVGVARRPGQSMCPVQAFEDWCLAADITAGPVFISLARGHEPRAMRGKDIAERLSEIANEAGLPGIWRSHSLRRGVVTSAESINVARSRTRLLTGWKSDAMFPTYADHEEKIVASPVNEIFERAEERGQL